LFFISCFLKNFNLKTATLLASVAVFL